VHDEIGYNYRLPNLNAALGCARWNSFQHSSIPERDLAARYIEFFKAPISNLLLSLRTAVPITGSMVSSAKMARSVMRCSRRPTMQAS